MKLAQAVHYSGAGTLEYLYDDESREFFFIEMNTRIQVEQGAVEGRRPRARVDHDPPHRDRPGRLGGIGPPQDGADARIELVRREGFHEVVVRPGVQQRDGPGAGNSGAVSPWVARLVLGGT